jgi:hypothetical protein
MMKCKLISGGVNIILKVSWARPTFFVGCFWLLNIVQYSCSKIFIL